MKYLAMILEASGDAEGIEKLYHTAKKENALEEFTHDLLACYAESPENLLYQAWYYRLQQEIQAKQRQESKNATWKLAIPLGIMNGLVFWALSGSYLEFGKRMPYLFLLWAPVTAFFVIGLLIFNAKKQFHRYYLVIFCLLVASAYVLLVMPGQNKLYQGDYSILAALHLPLLAWVGTGLCVLGYQSDAEGRFAFLIKSLEVFITSGVYLIVWGIFSVITTGLFQALNIQFSEWVIRLIFAGGAGLIPLLAIASVYDPRLSAGEQDFGQGLSKYTGTMLRFMIPLTLVVLVIYLLAIPFNFIEPFKNRNVLIVYNVMLFAVMGLLIGATPIEVSELSPRFQVWLRRGIFSVALLTVVISLYALSATVYRTILGGITINRLTVIGWNTLNIAILVILLYRQVRGRSESWAGDLKAAFKIGTVGYTIWGVFLLFAIPLLFR